MVRFQRPSFDYFEMGISVLGLGGCSAMLLRSMTWRIAVDVLLQIERDVCASQFLRSISSQNDHVLGGRIMLGQVALLVVLEDDVIIAAKAPL
jgi:hypothetical protein